MNVIVKFPAKASGDPDKYFCGTCGRRNQPICNDNVGFGPCVDGAVSPIDCEDLRRSIVQAHRMAAALERPLNPEWAALIARLGIPATLISAWVAEADARAQIDEFLAKGRYGLDGGAPFMQALQEWVVDGPMAHEKILALIADLKVHCDPTEGGARHLSYVDIADWFERLGKLANEILSDPGAWEMVE